MRKIVASVFGILLAAPALAAGGHAAMVAMPSRSMTVLRPNSIITAPAVHTTNSPQPKDVIAPPDAAGTNSPQPKDVIAPPDSHGVNRASE